MPPRPPARIPFSRALLGFTAFVLVAAATGCRDLGPVYWSSLRGSNFRFVQGKSLERTHDASYRAGIGGEHYALEGYDEWSLEGAKGESFRGYAIVDAPEGAVAVSKASSGFAPFSREALPPPAAAGVKRAPDLGWPVLAPDYAAVPGHVVTRMEGFTHGDFEAVEVYAAMRKSGYEVTGRIEGIVLEPKQRGGPETVAQSLERLGIQLAASTPARAGRIGELYATTVTGVYLLVAPEAGAAGAASTSAGLASPQTTISSGGRDAPRASDPDDIPMAGSASQRPSPGSRIGSGLPVFVPPPPPPGRVRAIVYFGGGSFDAACLPW